MTKLSHGLLLIGFLLLVSCTSSIEEPASIPTSIIPTATNTTINMGYPPPLQPTVEIAYPAPNTPTPQPEPTQILTPIANEGFPDCGYTYNQANELNEKDPIPSQLSITQSISLSESFRSIQLVELLSNPERILFIAETEPQKDGIYLYDLNSKKLTTLIKDQSIVGMPVWNGTGVSFATQENTQLILKFTDGMTTKELHSNIISPYLQKDPVTGETITILSEENRLTQIDNDSRTVAISPELLNEEDIVSNFWYAPKFTFSPNNHWFIQYDFNNFYLGDRQQNTICKIQLPENSEAGQLFAYHAVWHPNSQQIALIISRDFSRDLPYDYSQLAIVDLQAKTITAYQNSTYGQFVRDIDWTANGHHLIIQMNEGANPEDTTQSLIRLYQVNILEGSKQALLSDVTNFGSTFETGGTILTGNNQLIFLCIGSPICVTSLAGE